MTKKAAKKKASHGGKREGAGRPELDQKTTKVSMRLPPDVVEWIAGRVEANDSSQAVEVTKAIRFVMTCKTYPKAGD